MVEQYNIPFLKKSSLKWYIYLLFSFCTLLIAGGSIFFFVVMKDDFSMGLFFGVVMFVMSIYFAYIFVVAGVLKKFYIEITSEYIKFSSPFKSKIAYWREIYEAQVYENNNNTIILILLKKDINKKRRRTISNNYNLIMGIPPSSFQIPLGFFKDIDTQRLLLTMESQINKVDIKDEVNIDILCDSYEQQNNSIIKAIAISSLFCNRCVHRTQK